MAIQTEMCLANSVKHYIPTTEKFITKQTMMLQTLDGYKHIQ